MKKRNNLWRVPVSIVLAGIGLTFAGNVFSQNRGNSLQDSDTLYQVQVMETPSERKLKKAERKINLLLPSGSKIYRFLKTSRFPTNMLYVGYFGTKKKAEDFQRILKDDFPDSLIIPSVEF